MSRLSTNWETLVLFNILKISRRFISKVKHDTFCCIIVLSVCENWLRNHFEPCLSVYNLLPIKLGCYKIIPRDERIYPLGKWNDIHLRYHWRKIGVFVPSQIVCKPSMVTPIKFIFSESLLNKDCNFGFCFDKIDHNKQRQHFVCNYDVAQL